MRFWASWVQPTEDYRPLTYPPNEAILGWWCSGYDSQDNGILCAVVKADTEDDALSALRKDWPELPDSMRFMEAKKDGYIPGDRFPASDWMTPRLQSA